MDAYEGLIRTAQVCCERSYDLRWWQEISRIWWEATEQPL